MKKTLRFLLLAVMAASATSCTYYRKARTYTDKKRTRHVAEKELFEPHRTSARPETANRRNIDIMLPDGNILRGFALVRPEPDVNVIYFGGAAEMAQAATAQMTRWSEHHNANMIFVDYRGYGASSGLPALKFLPGDALYVYDGTSGIRGETSTIVLGYSLGAIPATYLAAQRPVQGLMLMAPVSSFSDKDMYPKKQIRRDIRKESPWYFAPFVRYIKVERNYELVENSEPLHQIAQVSAPLFVMHGEADKIVPIVCGKKIFDLATGNKKMLPLKGLGHDDLSFTGGLAGERFAAFKVKCLTYATSPAELLHDFDNEDSTAVTE